VKIAVACEDPTNDQFIIRPVLERLCAHLGRPRAKIFTITNPHTRGFNDLRDQACGIMSRYGALAAAVVFVIDVDCDDGRTGRINKPLRFRNTVSHCSYAEKALIVAAVQELEVWALWGVRGDLGAVWDIVRDNCDPKETFFEPQLTREDKRSADGGRGRLVGASLQAGWPSLAGGCPELAQLADELAPLI
jgi:hypothetical protein